MHGVGHGDYFTINYKDKELSNRQQRTKLNTTVSSLTVVTCGVPQGSVLGPLLFIIYLNVLEKWLAARKLQLYADDIVIYTKGNSQREEIENLNKLLSKLNSCCETKTIINSKTIKNSDS